VESNVVYAGLPDWAEMCAWQKHLKRGDLFIDVGASVGPYSLWACELGARAVAIEPSQFMLDRLAANVALNGYDVEIVPAAAGDTPGMGFSQLAGWGSDTTHFPDVRVVTVDEILGDRTAAGMKIDVEGAEIVVLRGAKRALAERRIKLIQLEWNNTSVYLRRETREPVAEFLRELGYALFRAADNGQLVEIDDVATFGPDVFAVAPD
jgi:FkbM family methyltransferase